MFDGRTLSELFEDTMANFLDNIENMHKAALKQLQNQLEIALTFNQALLSVIQRAYNEGKLDKEYYDIICVMVNGPEEKEEEPKQVIIPLHKPNESQV